MARCFFICVIAWLLTAVAPVNGRENLFEVAVPVSSQSSTERAQAASIGLRKVIQRLAGTPDMVDAPALRQAYAGAQNYIEQFHYEPFSAEQRDSMPSDASELLVMTFSQRVVEQLLREAGQPYWPPNRPKVFVWLVEDVAEQGRVLINDRANPVLAGLLEGARNRGLEVQLPLLDLEDQLALPARQLWRLNEQAILDASDRYDADTILVGRFSQASGGQWLSTWQFLHRGANREFDLRTDSARELGQQAINPLADYLANLYAVIPQEEGSPKLVVQISGVKQFGHYRQALDYIQQLAVVTQAELQAVQGDMLLMQLQVDGGLDALRNALTLDKKLQPSDTLSVDVDLPPWLRPQEGTTERPARYMWQGS